MSVHHGLRPVLMALLSGVLLNVSLPDISCAGQDLRYLSFHPVPLRVSSSGGASSADVSMSAGDARASTVFPADAASREATYRDRIAELRLSEGSLALPLAEQLLALGHALHEQA
ncbi:MAG TPA: hypothetical protein VGE69_15840, partial [Pseudomonadales bacterium]